MRRFAFAATLWALSALVAVACGTQDESVFDPNADGGGGSSGDPGPIGTGEGGPANPQGEPITLDPPDPVVTFTAGQAAPTVTFRAVTANGTKVPATFAIDRGELGTVGTSSGLFTASGKVGGKATVTGTWNGRTAATSVTVKLVVTQNGPGVGDDAGAGGAGGAGGVGGEGLGSAVDPTTADALKKAPSADTGLAWLYPYDKTVWPRGVLAPLLQWTPGAQGDYDAVAIKITEAAFTYEGTFTKPNAAGATPFRRHPIPQAAWRQMLQSNGGEDVTISLTFAKGGASFGPITETWKVASAPLKGTVYYNSYGTRLAKNYTGAKGGDGRFGGATLAVRGGSTDPTLVAGSDGDANYCRVCHSVAANGSVLITQRNTGDQRRFSSYDLKTSAETTMSPEGSDARWAWPAIYPDGSVFLNDSSSAEGSTNQPNELWQVVSGAGPKTPTKITSTGWPDNLRAAFPSFAPDGKQLAFTMFAGKAGDERSIATLGFDKATSAFSGYTKRYTPPNPAHTALYPSFTPNGKGVVFHVETRYNTRDYGGTRSDADVSPPDARASRGTRAELWYLDLATNTATRLDKLNGLGYLPQGPESHDDDATLNYEPTVNPVVSGGYAWVVFTSRRLYGNVATINPWWSDPRYVDLTSTPTPKKLWVAAIDLNAPPGTDPSHPAFYLPGQELLAGNMRGYWVVDPCKADASGCETGDECCGGYCRPSADGALVCTDKVPVCAQEFEKCTKDADCCNSPAITCVNGRCAQPGPK